MKSFEPGFLERQTVPISLLGTVRLLGELKARQGVSSQPSLQALDRLRQAALLESAESSNRLDAIVVPFERVADLVARRADPLSRPEQEVAGYRDALERIASNAGQHAVTPQVVLELHADLYRFVPEGGGRWKISDDLVTETQADGSSAVVFTPVPAYTVEDAMNRLHEGLARLWAGGIVDPLLLVPAYLLDFLCIHPFSDGSERVARLLARLLLEKAGYHVTTFMSLDPLFESTRAACSAALQASWRGWHQARHNLAPWWEYFLGVVLQAYQALERRLAVDWPPRGAKRQMVLDAVRRLPREFRHGDLERLVPSISRPTINRVLRQLRTEREVRCVKPGRHARWQRSEPPP